MRLGDLARMRRIFRVKEAKGASLRLEAEWDRVHTPLCQRHGAILFFWRNLLYGLYKKDI